MDLIESVRHDAAALCQFVDQVAARCILAESPSYTAASEEFFKYISDLGSATKAHLEQFVQSLDSNLAQTDPDALCTDAQQIRTLRYGWFKLHSFVKPALDADTLEVPHTLVKALTERLRSLPGFQDARFAVLHTSNLNYYHVNTGYITELAAELATNISGAPSFPKNLGLIVIPYSQVTALFLNTALAHEMGHYTFDKRHERTDINKLVVKELLSHKDINSLLQKSALEIQLCIDRCIGWLTEVYCDLFALYLVGPCFAFGFVELFALSRVSRLSGPNGSSSPVYSLVDFSESHPAEALRLREQTNFMKRATVNWWNEVDKSSSSHVALLREASTVLDSSLVLDPRAASEINRIALDVFLKTLPSIHSAVEAAFQGVSSDVQSFTDEKVLIQKYLSYGVVPSRLVENSHSKSPTMVALLNSAHFFYLDEFDKLLGRIEGAEPSCLQCRSMWAQKLEMWTTKALEDISN